MEKNGSSIMIGLLLALPAALPAMERLGETEMASITARDGIALDIDFRLNMVLQEDGSALPAPQMDNCDDTHLCNLAVHLSGQASGSEDDEWLVLKDVFADLRVHDLLLDAAETPDADSPFADPDRFLDRPAEDPQANCLIDTDPGEDGCQVNALPALALSFPEGSAADIEVFARMGRMALEYGDDAFDADQHQSLLGLRLSDSGDPGAGQAGTFPEYAPATIEVQGRAMFYGF